MEYGSSFLGARLAKSEVFTTTIMLGMNTDKQGIRDQITGP
jgi:hypothetical protein